MKKLLTIMSVAAGIGLLVIFLFYQGIIRMNYPSYNEFPVQGIDVSHHQGIIDWQQLAGENISFAFIKATEGANFRDTNFRVNWESAKNAGITVGAYHFYRFCKSGTEQAQNYIATVPKEDGTLPPVIDLEFGGNCKSDNGQNDFNTEVKKCIDLLEEHYGKKPVIYATNEFYKKNIQHRFAGCPIWIRDIYDRPSLPDKRDWAFWQFANRGHLDGIEGHVDLNVFQGNRNEFLNILKSSVQ